MNGTVNRVIFATLLSSMAIGCATSKSAHGPRHSSAEVELAMRDTERSVLTRMAYSIDPETAAAARQIARTESR